ncbi:AAA family ATPase [Bradyrhizobium sp. CCGUVB14]|uniref:AAA family ATPase n=1 Tax=Bradyrhizobium sp. CCGUVB14 TaxID=2949628 RepID=UPI0020B45F0A|nr:AAA family ATPase [Bradyrhizobium sp. CCGUVB14]MCP3442712.1 AAA family ATPase [Bradyrhizobium sp. CCGUVB14]
MAGQHPIPTLIVFGGLPGTGKTTLSRELTRRLAATYIRVDAIEQTLRGAGRDVGPMGYVIANALAGENLRLGRMVVADCVNPVQASRDGWRQTAMQASARIAEIEVICSDVALHRQRAEARASDIAGLKLPGWQDIVGRHYESWDRDRLVLDTADASIDHLLERAESYVRDGTG